LKIEKQGKSNESQKQRLLGGSGKRRLRE